MNRITIEGRIGKEPKNGIGKTGKAWCSFSIADSESKEKPTIWWRCMASGATAETVADNYHKGSKIKVEGKVSESEWNGQKQLDVFVFKVLGDAPPIRSADDFGQEVDEGGF